MSAAASMSCPVTSPIVTATSPDGSTSASYQSPPTWSPRTAGTYAPSSVTPSGAGRSVRSAVCRTCATSRRCCRRRARSSATAVYPARVVRRSRNGWSNVARPGQRSSSTPSTASRVSSGSIASAPGPPASGIRGNSSTTARFVSNHNGSRERSTRTDGQCSSLTRSPSHADSLRPGTSPCRTQRSTLPRASASATAPRTAPTRSATSPWATSSTSSTVVVADIASATCSRVRALRWRRVAASSAERARALSCRRRTWVAQASARSARTVSSRSVQARGSCVMAHRVPTVAPDVSITG